MQKKMEKPKSKSAKSKKRKSKIKGKKKGKKGKTKRGKNGKKMDLSICIFFVFFCFFDLLFVCFFLLLFCFFPGKKQKKSKTKAKKTNRKSKKKATKMQMDKSIFSHFFTLFDVPLFSHLFCFLFFSVLKFCFLIFHVFSFFFVFFSSLKNIRTKGRGEHKSRSSLKLARTDRHSSIVSFLSSGHFKLPSFPEEHIINRVDNVNRQFTWIGCHSAGWRNLDKLTENNLSPCLFVSGKDSNPSRPLLFFAWWDCQQCVWALMRIA